MEINRSFIAIFQASGFIKIETYSDVSRAIKEKLKPYQAGGQAEVTNHVLKPLTGRGTSEVAELGPMFSLR